MNELVELLNNYTEEKGNWHLMYNPHKSYYETIEEYFDDRKDDREEIPGREYEKIKESNTLYELLWYNLTPVGRFTLYGSSIESLVEQVKSIPICDLGFEDRSSQTRFTQIKHKLIESKIELKLQITKMVLESGHLSNFPKKDQVDELYRYVNFIFFRIVKGDENDS